MKVWLNGKLVERENAVVSVFDHGLLYGDGVFEGIRSYHGKVFQHDAHIDRLYKSAQSILLEIPYTKAQIKKAVVDTFKANKMRDGYARLVVTRGPGNLGLDPKRCERATVFVITDQLSLYPKEWYETGMPIIVASTLRLHPGALPAQVKSLNYLNNILGQMEARTAGVNEAIMLNNQGYVAECTADNIFIVRNGELHTPPESAGILVGITRNFVMGLARKLRIPVFETNLTKHDLYTADECFLTGTGAEIMPITAIDRRKIGSGKCGPVTARLLAGFRKATK